ncbi:MAG: hypothetical protein P8Y18_02760 [Candidatus Bathyarchaeota archaeon]
MISKEFGITKKTEFISTNFLHTNWLDLIKEIDISKNIEVLSRLLSNSSYIPRTNEEILDNLYDATLAILDTSPKLNREEKTRAQYFSYNLCSCDECQKECAAHINKKGQIRISKKVFINTLKQTGSSPPGLLELMYIILFEMLSGIFIELDRKTLANTAQDVWKSGMTELNKE